MGSIAFYKTHASVTLARRGNRRRRAQDDRSYEDDAERYKSHVGGISQPADTKIFVVARQAAQNNRRDQEQNRRKRKVAQIAAAREPHRRIKQAHDSPEIFSILGDRKAHPTL